MKITNIVPIEVYQLHIVFEDGVEGDIDLTPQNDESVFLQLEEDELRKNPQISGDRMSVYWNEGLSIDSMACYNDITGSESE